MAKKEELQIVTRTISLAECEPVTLGRSLRQVRTVKDALTLSREQNPSLARLRADYGEEAIEDIIRLYLIDLRENVNLKRPLRDAQVDNIACEVVAEYYSLTIADVHVIFRKAKMGDYGILYESLDTAKVMTWFREYFADRCETGANMSVNSQFYDKGGNMTPERMTKQFNAMQDKFNKSKK